MLYRETDIPEWLKITHVNHSGFKLPWGGTQKKTCDTWLKHEILNALYGSQYNYKAIAREWNISENTLKNWIKEIVDKQE